MAVRGRNSRELLSRGRRWRPVHVRTPARSPFLAGCFGTMGGCLGIILFIFVVTAAIVLLSMKKGSL